MLHDSQKFITINNIKLKVHKDFDPEKYTGCNGCGSGWNEPLVPDSIYFVSITVACCPHDFRYERGGTLDDKHIADEEFLYNMIAIVEAYGNGRWYYPTSMARSRAMTYYSAVASLGEDVFLANNKGENDGGNHTERAACNRGRDNRAGEQWRNHREHRVLRSKSKRGV